MKVYNDITHVNEPLLEDGQLYIYVVENYPQGYIKIGKSTNIQQRLKSLEIVTGLETSTFTSTILLREALI